jgi:trigger factor
MQVSVEQLEGLERRMTVQVPAGEVDQEIQSRLQSMTRKARIDGFRPGKVPLKVIKRMYGLQIRQEVLSETMEKSLQDAITQEQLRLAGAPKVEPLNIEEGQNFEYSATFEVFPEFTPNGIEGRTITQPVAQISAADIDNMIESLRKQRTNWIETERAAQNNDRVTISFEGTLNGEPFPGGSGENAQVVLGEGRMLADFEQQLAGLAADQAGEFDLQFPDDYHADELAGNTVHFKIQMHKVEEAELPVIDEAFAQEFGIEDGSLDGLRNALQQNMERELVDGVKSYVKNQVMDVLLQTNTISVPQSLVDSEIESLAKQAGFPDSEGDDAKATKARLFEQNARRRVNLGLIVAKLTASNELEVDESRVQERLESIAASYEDSEEVVRYYRQNTQMMQGIYDVVLEDQIVDWLLESAVLEQREMSFEDVMKPKPAAAASDNESASDAGE